MISDDATMAVAAALRAASITVRGGRPGLAWARGVERLPGILVDARDAELARGRLRVLAGRVGHWPVILGSPEEVRRLRERAIGGSRIEILREAAALDVEEWFRSRRERAVAWHEALFDRRERAREGDRDREGLPAPVESISPPRPATVREGKVALALIPGDPEGLAVAAALGFGGSEGDCPPPPVHSRIWRDWRSAFGAEIVSLSADRVEFVVARPPTDLVEARALATRHWLYCPSRIAETDADGALDRLASLLLRNPRWRFRWPGSEAPNDPGDANRAR